VSKPVEETRADLPYRCRECGKSFERAETITEHEAV